ncbi:hypothetical protein DHW03_00585 [Pedobacter yonginense]|uniref:Uncharacterized protein n=1 Tax=Pedobacter yonginense TaxID=651869 RepID=A0A317ETB1_9SPHI|nr:hypothetical protein [Pedobacter yonginense]PWS28388.1 hypothetical protein DHW03_00585 [Pedobacter yonginense]
MVYGLPPHLSVRIGQNKKLSLFLILETNGQEYLADEAPPYAVALVKKWGRYFCRVYGLWSVNQPRGHDDIEQKIPANVHLQGF